MLTLTGLPPKILLQIFTHIPPPHLPSVHFASKYFHLLLTTPQPYLLPITDNVGLPSLIWASKIGHEDLVQFLLDHGVPVNYPDSKRKTALHRAAKYGHESIVKLLLQRGAAPAVWDSSTALTAMHCAAMTGQIKILKMLVDAGAWLEAVDRHGWTPLHWAVDGRYTIERLMLLQYGVSSAYKLDTQARMRFRGVAESRAAETCRFLLGRGADVTSCYDFGSTPLHRAVARGGCEIVRVLLEGGAGVTVGWGDALGLCPFTMVNRSPRLELKGLMLEAGPGVEMRGEGGQINPHLEMRRTELGEGLEGAGDGVVGGQGGMVDPEVINDVQDAEDGKVSSYQEVRTLEMEPFCVGDHEEGNLILPRDEDPDVGTREAARQVTADAQDAENNLGDPVMRPLSLTSLNFRKATMDVQDIENLGPPLGPEAAVCVKRLGVSTGLRPTEDNFRITMPIQAGLA